MLAIIMAIEDEDDRSFVETIFNKYAEKMYLEAVNILHNHADAEDCVQDTIVKIIDKLDRFKHAQQEDYRACGQNPGQGERKGLCTQGSKRKRHLQYMMQRNQSQRSFAGWDIRRNRRCTHG